MFSLFRRIQFEIKNVRKDNEILKSAYKFVSAVSVIIFGNLLKFDIPMQCKQTKKSFDSKKIWED